MLPTGAKPIVDARIAGKRPAELLIVSLVGRLPAELNPVILADGNDWRFLEGMQVCVFARKGTPFRQRIAELAYHGPRWLGLWDVERHEGADVIAHLRLDCLDKTRFSPVDFTAIFWPWSTWQNQKFEESHATH